MCHVMYNSVSAQVADECLAPDVLSTVKEMKAVNFRRVPKMPVYGVAQPTSEVQHIPSHCHHINTKAFIYSVTMYNHTNPKQHLYGLNPWSITSILRGLFVILVSLRSHFWTY